MALLDSSPAHLWFLRKDGLSRSCEMRFVKVGVQVRVLRNDGGLLYSRIFPEGEQATAWANEERNELLHAGWIDSPATEAERRM